MTPTSTHLNFVGKIFKPWRIIVIWRKKALGTTNSWRQACFQTLSAGGVLTGFLERRYHWELRWGSLSKLDCDKSLDESHFGKKNTFLLRSFQYLRSMALISFLLQTHNSTEKDSLSTLLKATGSTCVPPTSPIPLRVRCNRYNLNNDSSGRGG